MEGERPCGQGQLLCEWTVRASLGVSCCEMTILCYKDCGNILLMYQNKFQKKF